MKKFPTFKDFVEAAKVKINGGNGVVCEGGFVLTSAHVLHPKMNGELLLSEVAIESFTTVDGRDLFAKILHCDIAADLAILGCFSEGRPQNLVNFFQDNPAVAVSRKLKFPSEIDIEVFAPCGVITGTAAIHPTSVCKISLQTDIVLKPGDSGSPIFHAGKLIGVVSRSDQDARWADTPLISRCLPVWLNAQITNTKHER